MGSLIQNWVMDEKHYNLKNNAEFTITYNDCLPWIWKYFIPRS